MSIYTISVYASLSDIASFISCRAISEELRLDFVNDGGLANKPQTTAGMILQL